MTQSGSIVTFSWARRNVFEWGAHGEADTEPEDGVWYRVETQGSSLVGPSELISKWVEGNEVTLDLSTTPSGTKTFAIVAQTTDGHESVTTFTATVI